MACKAAFGNVFIDIMNEHDILALLASGDKKSSLFYLNAHCFNVAQKDEDYKSILNSADFVLNDGIGLKLGAQSLGIKFRGNLNGTDLTPKILKQAELYRQSVFLFGAAPGVAEACTKRLRKEMPNLIVKGFQDGFTYQTEELVDRINKLDVDILIVALGVPIQEKWIAENIDKLNVRLLTGVGAFLDFYSGRIRRAPWIFRRLRLEWVFRLFREPRRLWRRYLIGNVRFILNVLNMKFRERM